MPQPPYEYKAFPAWMNGPNGQRAIFNSEEEVPPGWHRDADRVDASPEELIDDLDESEEDEVEALLDNNTVDDLIGFLEEMQEVWPNKEIEFSKGWNKRRLAATIVAYGGPVPSESEEE